MIQDWDSRPLPSEARCRVWYEQGGTWHRTTNEIDGAFCMGRGVRSSYPSDADKPLWRPWKGNNPATWSEFFSATHPPIPEGWEKVGEWRYEPDASCYSHSGVARDFRGEYKTIHSDGWWLLVRRVLPAVPQGWEAVGEWEHRADGDTVMFGSTTDGEMLLHESGSIGAIRPSARWFRRVRRILPPADWGDVPRGVELNPDKGAVMLVTSDGQAVTHGIVWFAQGVWRSAKTMEHDAQRADSLPAAIVALTGRRK